ncbi:MAG: dihydroxyacetone kinase subunit L [Mycoplasmataceae bacterium]|nr:dihydroxyacetone kinase subunit L [Mycoplasmataceae bacterium]
MTIKEALIKINDEVNKREAEITAYDQIAGDGDHALNLQRGTNAVIKTLDSVSDDPKEIFSFVGKTFMNVIGGTSGAIYGMAFLAGAIAVEGKEWNFDSLLLMISTAAKRITKAGGAQLGEKTLYDVWGAVDRDLKTITTPEILRANIIKYMEATYEMQATKGRASYTGERSKDVMDPGAVTSEIIIRFLSETI